MLSMAGDPEADSGRFGKVGTESDWSCEECLAKSIVAASAVLGLCWKVLCSMDGEFKVDVARAGLAIELILLFNEWPNRIVEVLPSVSEEISERGLGITSIFSANSTLGRGPVALSRCRGDAGGDRALIDCLDGLCEPARKSRGASEGVDGCEVVRALDTACALIRSDVSMSVIEIACDRR